MPPDAVASLRCPICQDALRRTTGPRAALVCGSRHSFDAAKQGYYNLLTGKGTPFEADSADMVAARHSFLAAGHYAAMAAAVAELAAPALAPPNALVLDAGTGTGHYLRSVLDRSPAAAIGLDISKFALRRAARLNPEAVNLVWDIWRPLPVADAAVDVVLVVFAPRNPAEFARVLRPGGALIVVTPRPGHLAEIAARTGMLGIEDGKAERLAESMQEHFAPGTTMELDIPLQLTGTELADLAFMGPAGHHLDRAALARSVRADEAVTATARFGISVFTTAVSTS
ncbi:methyltransferase domain-containing protein [Arthrobacter cavernae]|uniref:Methyltransferase domain-containing protein n=1 Tax=Arthrobacter cavernae TaxID=2817681 RepID=A0A939KNB2_9MICC|nr:methyltransferase domain-containing protein [Arthrobacter cavernae]MBO1269101.1 methyltransferase domain-containing protein [Arthrobacter cavernae]